MQLCNFFGNIKILINFLFSIFLNWKNRYKMSASGYFKEKKVEQCEAKFAASKAYALVQDF